MIRNLSFSLVFGTAALLLSSCQKELQAPAQAPSVLNSINGSNGQGYDPPYVYQVELSGNIPSVQGGGVWLWIGLNPNGTGDYSGSDCGHGGQGAASDKGDVTWSLSGSSIVINGVTLNGLGGFPTTITVPSTYGHYTGTIGTYLTLPPFIPPFVGTTQLTVAP
jgi:hypothetical protein